MKRAVALLLCFSLLAGCSSEPIEPAASAGKKIYALPDTSIDLTFLKEPVSKEPETDSAEDVRMRYDTQIRSADNTVLAELTAGEWELTEAGLKHKALIESVTPDAVIGPDIHNVLRMKTGTSDAAYEQLVGANIEGCVIVSDPHGQVELVVNNPPDKNYAAMPNFNGSTAKLLVSTAMLDHKTELTYDDPGFYDPGWHRYYNHDTTVPYAVPVRRDLLNAFTESSNAYFMHAVCELLTHDKLRETYNKYYGYDLYGSAGSYYYPADWMRISQPDWDNIKDSKFERGKSAIGMSDEVKITPLFLNAVTIAIASDGAYQLNLKADSEPQKLEDTEPLPDDMRKTMWELMDSCAKYTDSIALAPLNGYTFYVKTGTADTHYGEHNEKYLKRQLLTGFLAKDGVPVKIITMYCHNGAERGGGGGSLAPVYRQIAGMMLTV